MIKNIKKVAVLGSGIMGSGIACQLANVGLEVILLDIIPENEKKSSKQNSISFLFAKKYIYFYYPFFWVVLLLYLFLK